MGGEPRSTVGDYVTLQRGTTYKGMLVGQPGPALLGLGSIEPGGGFREGRYKTYGGECPPNLMLAPGNLYVALKGATKDGKMIGSVARVPTSVPSGRLTQDTVKLEFRDREAASHASYLYWVLRTPQYRDYCGGHATGSAVVALSRVDFLSYPVPSPTPTRRKIVCLLEDLERKIELNRRTNETLEAMARALFKSWFVDFDPVRAKAQGKTPIGMDPATAALFPSELQDSDLGEIPKGWMLGELGDVARQVRDGVKPNEVPAETPYIGLEHMPQRSIALGAWGAASDAQSQKSQFRKGQILFGKLRPYFHKVGVAPVDGLCSTDIVVIEPIDAAYAAFCLGHASSDSFVAYTNAGSDGTRMPRTSWKQMAAYDLPIPPASIAETFRNLVAPLVERIRANLFESRILKKNRDALLPRLLSGDLAVAQAKQAAEDMT